MKLSNKSKQPKQVPPVQRPSTSAALSNENGVEVSGIFDILRMYG